MWNVADFVTNALYLATIALRLRAYYDVSWDRIILGSPNGCRWTRYESTKKLSVMIVLSLVGGVLFY